MYMYRMRAPSSGYVHDRHEILKDVDFLIRRMSFEFSGQKGGIYTQNINPSTGLNAS